MQFIVDDQTVEDDKVITHVTARSSTPVGPVMTMPANPEEVAESDTIHGMSTDRIADGKERTNSVYSSWFWRDENPGQR